MAFDGSNLASMLHNGINAPNIWTYTTTDSQADLNTAGYFNDAAGYLRVNDLIYGVTSTGTTAVHSQYIVLSNDGDIVDVSNGVDIAVTDGD